LYHIPLMTLYKKKLGSLWDPNAMLEMFLFGKKGRENKKITERSVIRSRDGGGTEHHSITLDLPVAHRVAPHRVKNMAFFGQH